MLVCTSVMPPPWTCRRAERARLPCLSAASIALPIGRWSGPEMSNLLEVPFQATG